MHPLPDHRAALPVDGVDETVGTVDASSLDLAEIQLRFVEAAVQDRMRDEIFGTTTWPVVGALLLEPSVFLRLLGRRLPGDPGDWRRLSNRLAGPASSLCNELADLEESAA